MSDEERLIPGVYNYCDRWCERCPLTGRCRLFATEQQYTDRPGADDPSSEAFWDTIGEVLSKTKQMILDAATEYGIDLDALDLEEIGREEEARLDRALEHPLVVAATNYGKRVDDWFRRAQPGFEDKEDQLNQQLALGLENLDPEAEAMRIRDAADVIRWYEYQVAAKLSRALADDPLDDEPETDPPTDDANGSVKVALLGADRSLAAWGLLRDALPEQADEILDILVSLDRLRRAVEKHFPRARRFLRPGFDAPPL